MNETMKHIKLLYFLTLSVLTGVFVYFQLKTYGDVRNKLVVESLHFNNHFAATTGSRLHETELLLDMIGHQLLDNDLHLDLEKSQAVMAEMLTRFPSVVGFGLTDPEGKYLAMSSREDLSNIKCLKKSDKTRESFNRTLQSDAMVIGTIHFCKIRNNWILPLRKALRDAAGNVTGVMITGIQMDKSVAFFQSAPIFPGQMSLLVNDTNRMHIYVNPLPETGYSQLFSSPVSRPPVEIATLNAKTGAGLSPEEIRKSEIGFRYEAWSQLTKEDSFYFVKYNKRYKIWAQTLIPMRTVRALFFGQGFFIQLVGFLVVSTGFLTLFHMLYRKEAAAHRLLSYQAVHDSLTDLYNRAALEDLSYQWITVDASPFLLLFIDLDNFKNINDSFGHTLGDKLLIEVSLRLKQLVPEDSEIVRNGGDEFSIFIKREEAGANSSHLGRRIVSEISKPYYISGLKLRIGCSVGISRYPEDGTGFEQLMVSADLALYTAKKKRNNYAFFNSELQKIMERKTLIEHSLHTAVEENELYMVFQPQVYGNGTIHGAEALVRWESPELGFVPPDLFIGVAEESGAMDSLWAFILDTSCAEFRKILDGCSDKADTLNLSINISVSQILGKNFKDELLRRLDHYRIRRSQTTIEITESMFIDELDYILPLLQEIRDTGISISMDDFGRGYSSLSMLRALPIDELKIDRRFVKHISEIKQDSDIIHSIIHMGHTMNMKVVAEGVEEKEQLCLLNSYHCELYQGYYFSRPLTAEDFVKFYQDKNERIPPLSKRIAHHMINRDFKMINDFCSSVKE
ncbi:bifunctional diguanylate cyclase/phosphodiesterase [Desulfobacter sp.]